MTTAYRRFATIVQAYKRLPRHIDSADAICAYILKHPDYRQAFTYKRKGERRLSVDATHEWLDKAHWWGILTDDRLQLSTKGHSLALRKRFAPQLLEHVYEVVDARYGIAREDLLRPLAEDLRGAEEALRPSRSNWEEIVVATGLPRRRFRELLALLLGAGALKTERTTLYFEVAV